MLAKAGTPQRFGVVNEMEGAATYWSVRGIKARLTAGGREIVELLQDLYQIHWGRAALPLMDQAITEEFVSHSGNIRVLTRLAGPRDVVRGIIAASER